MPENGGSIAVPSWEQHEVLRAEMARLAKRIAKLENNNDDDEPGPKAEHQFDTLEPGSDLPSNSEAAEAVNRHPWEGRPDNAEANRATPPDEFDVSHGWSGYSREALEGLLPRITGDPGEALSNPTTDELIRWAACKWGIDDDVARALCWRESSWRQSAEGDWTSTLGRCPEDKRGTDPCPESFGLTQIKHRFNGGTYPLSLDCTAFNLDYSLGRIRAAYEGWTYEGAASRGDLWGSIGMHFSGSYGSGYDDYVSRIQDSVDRRPWMDL